MDRPAWHVVAASRGGWPALGRPGGRPQAMLERTMKLVILERDGTINHDGDPFITSPEDWTGLPA